MAGYISEFFGYRAEDKSSQAATAAARQVCPFLGTQCTKVLSRDRIISGVCAVRQKTPGSPDVICCPNRIYAEDYKMLHLVAQQAFGCELELYSGRAAVEKAKSENGAIAVFGHGWGGELRLPQRAGTGSYLLIGCWHAWMEPESLLNLQLSKSKLLIPQETTVKPAMHLWKTETSLQTLSD